MLLVVLVFASSEDVVVKFCVGVSVVVCSVKLLVVPAASVVIFSDSVEFDCTTVVNELVVTFLSSVTLMVELEVVTVVTGAVVVMLVIEIGAISTEVMKVVLLKSLLVVVTVCCSVVELFNNSVVFSDWKAEVATVEYGVVIFSDSGALVLSVSMLVLIVVNVVVCSEGLLVNSVVDVGFPEASLVILVKGMYSVVDDVLMVVVVELS